MKWRFNGIDIYVLVIVLYLKVCLVKLVILNLNVF